MSISMRDRIAEAIFIGCRDEGIDDTLSTDDTYQSASQDTRKMYEAVADVVIASYYREPVKQPTATAIEIDRLWGVIKEARGKIHDLSNMEELP